MKARKDNIVRFLAVITLAIACKVFQFSFLPKKYFYDSGHILAVMNGSGLTDTSYAFTANFFNACNIFGLNDIYSWSILITAVFTLAIAIAFLLSKKHYTTIQYILIFSSIALLDIFAFNLSKEVIQLLIFFVAYLIIKSRTIKKDWQKVALCSLLFLLESLYFRIYYLILAALIPIIYITLKKTKRNKTNPYKVIIALLAAFYALTFMAGLISSDGIESILTARSTINNQRIALGDKDANTMINEVLGENKNFLIFSINYFIDFIRLLLPLELLMKGVKYFPFVLYQSLILAFMIQAIRNKNIIDADKKIALSCMLGFIMVSAIFEPDFGSFIRHQSCLLPILMLVMPDQYKCNKKEIIK
ncbi:hypothetical protein IKF15_04340 [Candidatus Saccharibacteria bacterium]|nr:hypothetical protein [Candidatus Saccharibacteria bacterium]